MEFIQDGVTLNDLLKNSKDGTRLLRDALSDREIEAIYRPFANLLLQLVEPDFDCIRNLDSRTPELNFPPRPITWKVHDILQTGGVNICGTFI
jgi:hypothetical protein